LAARFDRLGPQAPRLIGLDEAFAGMDLDNIGTLYRIMEALEFAWIATSERRIDTSAQLDGAATYELRTVPTPEGKLFGALGSVWDGQTTRSGTDYGFQS
ncbi:MAG: hypothetical protein Q4C67_09925, partial [Deinococcus sp.]|nr:hypothetical protein [Deinococcus sp.]